MKNFISTYMRASTGFIGGLLVSASWAPAMDFAASPNTMCSQVMNGIHTVPVGKDRVLRVTLDHRVLLVRHTGSGTAREIDGGEFRFPFVAFGETVELPKARFFSRKQYLTLARSKEGFSLILTNRGKILRVLEYKTPSYPDALMLLQRPIMERTGALKATMVQHVIVSLGDTYRPHEVLAVYTLDSDGQPEATPETFDGIIDTDDNAWQKAVGVAEVDLTQGSKLALVFSGTHLAGLGFSPDEPTEALPSLDMRSLGMTHPISSIEQDIGVPGRIRVRSTDPAGGGSEWRIFVYDSVSNRLVLQPPTANDGAESPQYRRVDHFTVGSL